MKLQDVGTRGQAIALAILALLFALFVTKWATGGSGGGTAAPVASSLARAAGADPEADRSAALARSKRAGKREATVEDVPAIRPEDLAPRQPAASALAGRDLFDFRQPTPVPPPPPPPTPTPQAVCGDGRYIGPCPPAPPPPPTATPSPPEIGFRCIGTFGPKDDPIAVLVQGDQIVDARAGDVVFDRFRVVRVGYESVEVGFVGGTWHWKETRRLAIAP